MAGLNRNSRTNLYSPQPDVEERKEGERFIIPMGVTIQYRHRTMQSHWQCSELRRNPIRHHATSSVCFKGFRVNSEAISSIRHHWNFGKSIYYLLLSGGHRLWHEVDAGPLATIGRMDASDGQDRGLARKCIPFVGDAPTVCR
jgi:hypothetical protein